MLKMYQAASDHAGTPDYWEANWSDGDLDRAVRFCEIEPLRALFERYTPPGTLMLEGGCGLGHYVTYYTGRGVRVVGLDFAQSALARLHRRQPHLRLCAGDVAVLPFRDGSFDVYYSGGVVEHFEAGAMPSILEAHRVLRPGGVLLISVPYLSPARKMLSLFRQRLWRRVSDSRVDPFVMDEGLKFFQYVYTKSEFEALLESAGFHVVTTQGYSILWGIYELPFLGSALQTWSWRRDEQRRGAPASIRSSPPRSDGSKRLSLMTRLVASEDATVPLVGLVVRALRWACANIQMYVCVREAGQTSFSGQLR